MDCHELNGNGSALLHLTDSMLGQPLSPGQRIPVSAGLVSRTFSAKQDLSTNRGDPVVRRPKTFQAHGDNHHEMRYQGYRDRGQG